MLPNTPLRTKDIIMHFERLCFYPYRAKNKSSNYVMSISMETVEDVKAQVAQIHNQLEILLAAVRVLCEEGPVDDQAATIRATMEKIKAKEYASVAEAAFLMNCSDSHVRNLVEKAIVGTAPYPVPFADLDGLRVFPVQKLLEWTRIPKPKAKKTKKNELNLSIVES